MNTLPSKDDDDICYKLIGIEQVKSYKLEKENKKLKERVELLLEYKESAAYYSNECRKQKNENEALKEQIKCLTSNQPDTTGNNTYDICASRFHFKDDKGNYPTQQWTASFWYNLGGVIDLTTAENKIIIKNATSVVWVYKIITEDDLLPYRYTASRDMFCGEWNDCIAERLRREKLILKEKSFNSAINKPPFKGVKPNMWKRQSELGDHLAAQYDEGTIIKKFVESIAK